LPEGDLLVRCEIAAEPLPGYPQAIPRLVWLGCKGAGQLISADLPRAGSIVRGQPERPLDTAATGASIRYESHKRIGGESHEAYQVHPPYGNMQGPGAVFWEADVRLPASPCFLRFHTGLAETAKRSDGVAFRVSVKADGPPKTVFEIWHKKMEWVQREANLSPWAGRHVTLRFTVDSGPNDSSTADHAVWGDVSVGGFGRSYRRSPQTPGRIMALANAKPLEATFYFRDAGPAAVDLSVEIEGAAPARISNFTVHAATDALAREFANGVVLANPALREYTFDLGALFPGIQLKRLQGSPAQDPEVNNGRLVGESVTLGGRDGLFLERNSEAHGP
jgi:hypothetical protein